MYRSFNLTHPSSRQVNRTVYPICHPGTPPFHPKSNGEGEDQNRGHLWSGEQELSEGPAGDGGSGEGWEGLIEGHDDDDIERRLDENSNLERGDTQWGKGRGQDELFTHNVHYTFSFPDTADWDTSSAAAYIVSIRSMSLRLRLLTYEQCTSRRKNATFAIVNLTTSMRHMAGLCVQPHAHAL